MIAEIKAYIDARFDRLEMTALLGSKEIFTIEEAMAFTGVKTRKTMYNMTSARQIPHYKRGGTLYFKKSELERWMTARRVKTTAEVEREATTYVEMRRCAK